MNNKTYQDGIREAATQVIKSKDLNFPCSTLYEIAREIWKLYWAEMEISK